MNSKYMIIISFDAVSSEDLEVLSTYPNFKSIIEKGSVIKSVQSINPTLTYPVHTTIVTGKYPMNHGIVDNTIFKAGDLNPNWYWCRKYIKGDTIYDLAKKKGLKTCSLLWPVTAKSNIDYNLPEIFPVKKYHNQIMMSMFAGSLFYQLKLEKKFGHIRKGISQPALDDFVLECTKYTIKNYAPNLMMIHFTDTDTNKHLYGFRGKEISNTLKRHDRRLGEIIKTLKEKEIYEDSDLVLLGDHSALNSYHIIKLNRLFISRGFIKVNKNKILAYDCICKSLDGSCYIYLKDKNNESLKTEIYKLLNDFKAKNDVIDSILTEEEIIETGASRGASFMLDAKKGYYFVDDFNGKIIESIKDKDVGNVKHRYKGIHGYSPLKEKYETFFVGYGKDFKEGVVLDRGEIINHGPTLAKILGVELKDADGKAVDEILK